jgi:hypothetical protein
MICFSGAEMRFRRSSIIKCLLLLLIAASSCGGDEESKRELENLRQIAADTPLYPGFVQLGGNSEYQKTSHATVIRCYSLQAKDGDVRRFYSELFASKGWTLAEQENHLGGFFPEGSYRLTFRKGAYAIVLGHSNLDQPAGECTYSLAYYWNLSPPLM